jgi:hypothetical protein
VALVVVLFTLMVAGGLFLIWGKKDLKEEESVEKELVIPARWPRQKQGRALPEHRAAEHRAAEKLLAEKASAASAVSLLALSHIYTASSKGGDVAPTADEPVTKQQASTGG